MGVGQDWAWFDVEKEYGEEEDEVIWTHHGETRIDRRLTRVMMEYE